MKMSLQLKLKDSAVEILVGLLQPKEMIALYMLGTGETESKKFNNVDLIKIIIVLCEELRWTQEEKVDRDTPSENNKLLSDVSLIEAMESIKVEPDLSVVSEDLPSLEKTSCQEKFKYKPLPLPQFDEQLTEILNKHEAKTFDCYFCDKRFKEFSALDEHEKIHKRDLLGCSKCNKSFVSEVRLRAHEKTHHTEHSIKQKKHERFTRHPFSCSKCNKQFSKKTSFRSHETVCDKSTAQHGCSVCYKTVKHLKELRVIDPVNELYSCKKCDETLLGLKLSKTWERKGKKLATELPNTCSKCNKEFSNKINLELHERYMCMYQEVYQVTQGR